VPALFCGRKKMTSASHYTTNLSKAQGMITETFELLELWEPGMKVGELKSRARAMGALGKTTQVRVDDLVGRGFAQRYLIDGGKPAQWLRHMLLNLMSYGLLRQLAMIYTARANLILHDFISEVFWLKYSSKAGEVTKRDARDFIDRAVNRGALKKPWSENGSLVICSEPWWTLNCSLRINSPGGKSGHCSSCRRLSSSSLMNCILPALMTMRSFETGIGDCSASCPLT